MKTSSIIGFSVLGLVIVLAIVLAYVYGGRTGYDLAWLEMDQPDPLIPDNYDCKQAIKIGARGPEVLEFQAWYNQNRAYGSMAIGEDGIFGEETRKAADTLSLPSFFRLDQIAQNICA